MKTLVNVIKNYDSEGAILGGTGPAKGVSSRKVEEPKTKMQIKSEEMRIQREKEINKMAGIKEDDLRYKIMKIFEATEVPTVDNVINNYDKEKATLGRDINGNKYALTKKEKLMNKKANSNENYLPKRGNGNKVFNIFKTIVNSGIISAEGLLVNIVYRSGDDIEDILYNGKSTWDNLKFYSKVYDDNELDLKDFFECMGWKKYFEKGKWNVNPKPNIKELVKKYPPETYNYYIKNYSVVTEDTNYFPY